MNIQTFSVVVGGMGCNARCPFCVSKMTQNQNVKSHTWTDINQTRLQVAIRLAERCGCTTAMLTGKGEPTLHPEQINGYIPILSQRFPIIELQTNGILLPQMEADLENWKIYGLTSVCISAVHWRRIRNREIYSERYQDLERATKMLQSAGLSVRWNITMLKGYVDSVEKVHRLISYAEEAGVEQLTIRPVRRPMYTAEDAKSCIVHRWVLEHEIPKWKLIQIRGSLVTSGVKVLDLPFGAEVYDIGGQNVTIADCLTGGDTTEQMRNLIFFPDGGLFHRWDLKGARIL